MEQRLDLNVGTILPLNRCRIDAAGEVNSTSSTKTDSTSVQSSKTSSTTSIVLVARYIVVRYRYYVIRDCLGLRLVSLLSLYNGVYN